MIVPAKRTRLLEPTSYPMTSTTTNNNNDNNNNELSQQQFLSNKLYQEDHNHQLLPEFSNNNNNNNSLNGQLQTPQLHLQQLNSSSSSLSSTSLGILSDEQQLLTKDYLRNIEKKIELILENISQRSKGDINESSSRSSSKNDTNSIVLDLPTLVDDSKTEEKNVVTSPLSSLLNHTYPDSIIELVNKLNKISINNPDLDIPPFGKFLKVNNNDDNNNNNNNNNNNKVSSYPSPFTSPVSSNNNNNNNNNHHHLSSSSPLLSSSTSSSSLVPALSSSPQSSSVLSSQLSSVSSSASMSPSSSPSISDTKISSSPQPPPPSKELCHQLIQDYFKKLNPIYPILDRRRFSDVLQSKTIHSQLLINSVLSFAASKFSDDPSIRKTANKRGGIFFDAAKKILDSVYHEPKLETIQALLLLSQSEASISRLNSNYMFLGMAVSMSNSLQLHRVNDSLSSDEAEERSRIFYCVYCRNRWSSFFFAKPYSIDDTDINVPLPSLLNFDKKTRMFFIAYIKLSHILGQIWRFGYTIKPKACYENWHNHITDQKSTLRQIRSALAKWSKELPEELQYLPNTDSTSTSMKSNDFSVYAGYINMLFYTCILLLHQPYFANSSSSSSKAQSSKSDPYYYNHYNHAFVTSDKFTSPSFQSSTGPIKTCLTAAATITDISRTTRQLNEKAFLNFGFPAYSLMRSITLEAAIVCSNGTNGLSSEHIQEARRLLNDTLEELRHISNVINVEQMTKAFQEMERLVSFTNHGGELYIPLPLLIQFLENMNNNNNSNSSTSTSSNNNNNNNNKDNNNIINNNNIIINNNNNIDVKNNSKNKNNFAAPANPVTKVSNLRRNNSDSSLFKSSNSFAGNNNIINKNNTITSSTKITSNIDTNGDMIMENTSPFNNNNNNNDNDLFMLSSTPQSLITTPASAFTMTYDLFPTHNTATATAVNNDDNINSDNDNGGDLPWNQQYYDEIFFSTTSYAAILDSSNIDDNVL